MGEFASQTALAGRWPRAAARLGLSALIAFALAACDHDGARPDGWRECVNTRTGETFRFNTSTVRDTSGLLKDGLVVTDTDGFRRAITDQSVTELRCRDVASAGEAGTAKTTGLAEGEHATAKGRDAQ